MEEIGTLKYMSRPTKFRFVPWISWNGASVYFKAGLVVSWFGCEREWHWGGFKDG